MADVGQGEIGDYHGVQGIITPPQEEDYDSEVTLSSDSPPVMTMKKMVMLPLTVKMAIGALFSQTLPPAYIDLQHIGVLRTLWDLTDLRALVIPIPNLHVKSPIFSAKPGD